MRVTPDPRLPELLLVEPRVLRDARGSFRELYQEARYEAAGIGARFVQDNLSHSARHVLRGLHLQHPHAQGKLVTVLEGAAFDVAVDVRVGSPTFGRWSAYTLSERDGHHLWIPPGFAHGYLALEEGTLFSYKSTEAYSPGHELSLRWDDPAIGIAWPTDAPLLSEKDAAAPRLADVAPERLPPYGPAAGGAPA